MSKKILLSLSIAYFAVCCSLVLASDLRYKPGELIVRFAPKADGKHRTLAERNELLASIDGGTVKNSYKIVPGLTVVKLPQGKTVKDALPAFKNVSGILYAEPDYEIKLLSIPNDTYFPQLWGMHNTGQTGGTPDADIDSPEAWDIANDSDVIVAVLDSGVDYYHPDLRANMWVNPGEIPSDGNDNDHNGYVDDVYGWDFYDDVNDPMDYFGHGTHCAGTIGAVGNNGEGVTGVCWNVKIMALNISHYGEEGWAIFVSNAIEGMEYAVRKGAQVLNASWGDYTDIQSLKDEIEAADANGVLFVAAAGNYSEQLPWLDNDAYPVYPASYDCENIISVLATNHNDERPWWSHYGASSVDLGAPGTDILSCAPGGGYQYMSGTSMATPHVAGACALIWSMNRTLSHLQVRDIILNSVDQKLALNGLCVTGGRLNLYNTVANTPRPTLDKVDVNEPNSVLPYDEITYIIYYANPPVGDPLYVGTLTDVNIVDYLPEEVDPVNSFDPNYNSSAHTYTWNIGTLSPGGSNSIAIKVTVNELAEPLGTIRNLCVLRANEIRPVYAAEITDVNSWKPLVIYVDDNAPGSNTGMSWKNAYRDLQDALARARAGCGSQIWVAAGTYKPTTEPNSLATFQLVNDVPIYGGFPSGGGLRNWMANETILDGQNIDCNVITANGIEDATLDGFTIKGSYGSETGAGVYLDNADIAITNCKLKENSSYGINMINSSPYMQNCLFEDNSTYAINCDNSEPVITNSTFDGNNITFCSIYAKTSNVKLTNCTVRKHTYGMRGDNSYMEINRSVIERSESGGLYCREGSTLNLTNSVIRFNGNSGIYLQGISSATIKNNWIHNNSSDGIYCYVNTAPVIRNNTIVRNAGYGVYCDSEIAPDISNCIIWGNNNEGDQLYGCTATYSWFADPNFMNPTDPNDLHINGSPCKNAGNPNGNYEGETDIDGEDRVKYGRVDIGGDEYYWSPADFNNPDSRDGLVNFIDYAIFAQAWMSHPGDPNWNPDCNISIPANHQIDYADLAVFCEDWLWQAGWAKTLACGAGEGMSQSMGKGMSQAMAAALAATVGAAAEVSSQAISAESQIEKVEPVKIEQMIKWLEEIWLDPEVRESIDEDTWLKFIKSLREEL